jgi:hypothetical protein
MADSKRKNAQAGPRMLDDDFCWMRFYHAVFGVITPIFPRFSAISAKVPWIRHGASGRGG